jgi:hypothetical protein
MEDRYEHWNFDMTFVAEGKLETIAEQTGFFFDFANQRLLVGFPRQRQSTGKGQAPAIVTPDHQNATPISNDSN